MKNKDSITINEIIPIIMFFVVILLTLGALGINYLKEHYNISFNVYIIISCIVYIIFEFFAIKNNFSIISESDKIENFFIFVIDNIMYIILSCISTIILIGILSIIRFNIYIISNIYIFISNHIIPITWCILCPSIFILIKYILYRYFIKKQ